METIYDLRAVRRGCADLVRRWVSGTYPAGLWQTADQKEAAHFLGDIGAEDIPTELVTEALPLLSMLDTLDTTRDGAGAYFAVGLMLADLLDADTWTVERPEPPTLRTAFGGLFQAIERAAEVDDD